MHFVNITASVNLFSVRIRKTLSKIVTLYLKTEPAMLINRLERKYKQNMEMVIGCNVVLKKKKINILSKHDLIFFY